MTQDSIVTLSYMPSIGRLRVIDVRGDRVLVQAVNNPNSIAFWALAKFCKEVTA